MSEPVHVLVVDDEPLIRTMLRRYLVEQGFKVSEAADGAAMRTVIEHEAVDLVLLDLMMPGEDGFALTRYIRQRSDVPIIMLTSKSDLIDRVVGLEAGADDYVTKPFELREVLARIRTIMRRMGPRSAPATAERAPAPEGEAGTLVFQGLRLDLVRRELSQPSGALVPLSTAEFELLSVFARHPNRVLGRTQLMQLVKGREWASYERAIDTQVTRLRKKLEPDPGNPALIKTVRGAGYVFATTVTVG